MLAWPDGHDEVFEGAAEGRCVWPMRGDRGHGYDPMFQPDGHDADLRSDGPSGEEPDQPPRRRLRRAGGGLLCLTARPAEDWRAGGFGVYVHWPFCAAKCPYCDFNSHVRRGVDQARWRRALVAEVAAAARAVPGRVGRDRLLRRRHPEPDAARDRRRGDRRDRRGWSLAPDAEITLEANPTSVEAGRFRGYRDAGVNRLSMGVQALNDADLRALGRMHDTAEAVRAFEVARGIFPRVSFDLIYARQGQTLADWRAELGRALALAIDHLSLYQLTIEPGTRFGELAARGRLRGLPAPDAAADMYLATQEICAAAGLAGYEISNHARPGAESRHNLVYWRYGDYAGVGPGAHGRLTARRRPLGDRMAAPARGLARGRRERRLRRRRAHGSLRGRSKPPRCC